jgi:hypothetical protein
LPPAARAAARGGGGHDHGAHAGVLGRTGQPRRHRIFITPGFAFQVVDRLITNFHLPKSSTLMMLVSAFAGVRAHIMALYRHAIAGQYRFFSYGDAMLLESGSFSGSMSPRSTPLSMP